MEEMELGGLEDEVEKPVFGPVDDEYHLFEKDEVSLAFRITVTILLSYNFPLKGCWIQFMILKRVISWSSIECIY
uniref:Uncharacterized protein LOC103417209 n=1 Tax=Rhizophora mucronata TaxID=61149 RepID=A0A2P2M3D9_RHIMU